MAKLSLRELKKSILLMVAPRVIYVFFRILLFTLKKRVHAKTPLKALPPSVIIAFWHGEILSIPGGYKLYGDGREIDIFISEHKDGEIISRVVALFGAGSIRGSSTRGGVKALRQAFKSIEKQKDIGITPDGPKGPRHSIKDGIVALSQKKQIPIVASNFKASSFWKINSWDQLVIPKPFSTVDFYFSEPFFVDNLPMEEAKEVIKERLMENAI